MQRSLQTDQKINFQKGVFIYSPHCFSFIFLRRLLTARWQHWRAARQMATTGARRGIWSSVFWCLWWIWRMTATPCSTSTPTPPSQTRRFCPLPCRAVASLSSTSIQMLTLGKCTSRHSLECLVSVYESFASSPSHYPQTFCVCNFFNIIIEKWR